MRLLTIDTDLNRIRTARSAARRTNLDKRAKLPLIIWVVLFFLVLACVVPGALFGFNISGISWVVPLIMSIYVIATRISMVTFPWKLWLPWILMLIIHLLTLDYALLDQHVIPLQRTAQMLSPLFVGMAISTFRPTKATTTRFFSVLRYLAYVLVGLLVVTSGGNMRGFASQNMALLLLCVFFANRYLLFREKKDLQIWLVLACIPVLAITRTVIAASLLTFPLALSPMSIARRITFIVLMAAAGLAIFQLPAVQEKMFFSGHGELSEIGHSDDFATSGRSYMLELMYPEAETKHWFGHGTGGGETMAWDIARLAYPHDDWLLTYFDYGVVGVVILIACILLTIYHGFKAQRKCVSKETRLLFLTGLSAFVPFVLVMFTDNILVYASFFGMLHYTFLGLGYGALKVEQDAKRIQRTS